MDLYAFMPTTFTVSLLSSPMPSPDNEAGRELAGKGKIRFISVPDSFSAERESSAVEARGRRKNRLNMSGMESRRFGKSFSVGEAI